MILRTSPLKQYIKIWGIAIPIILIIYLILSFFKLNGLLVPTILGVIIISIILSLIYRFIYHHHYLELGENEVVYYTGILNIRAINVPYQKIDNVRTERPILSRILGLVNIYIDTPGEKGIEIMAYDMPYEEYTKFYEKLRKKMEEKRHGGYP